MKNIENICIKAGLGYRLGLGIAIHALNGKSVHKLENPQSCTLFPTIEIYNKESLSVSIILIKTSFGEQYLLEKDYFEHARLKSNVSAGCSDLPDRHLKH